MGLDIPSSNAALLERATGAATELADRYCRQDVVGIVFLGAIVRGYFDRHADIDLAFFLKEDLGADRPRQCQQYKGFQVHCWVSQYQAELTQDWPMGKRWAYSESRVYQDPEGLVSKLIAEKTKLGEVERRQLLMSGAALSEWYANRLTELWIERGSLLSAHSMFNQRLSDFYEMLFALNRRLVAADKWRHYYAERLPIVPENFSGKMAEVLVTQEITEPELRRRVQAFMALWNPLARMVEEEVGMTFEEFRDTV